MKRYNLKKSDVLHSSVKLGNAILTSNLTRKLFKNGIFGRVNYSPTDFSLMSLHCTKTISEFCMIHTYVCFDTHF